MDVRRTLTRDLRWRLNSFGTRSLQRILGYHWSDFVSNERLLRETQMRFITSIVPECQLQLYGHVAHFPDADAAHQILSARESHEWRRPMGRPRASWLQQVDQHLKEMGMGQASAWGMARRRPLEGGGWKSLKTCRNAKKRNRNFVEKKVAKIFFSLTIFFWGGG